MMIKEWFPRVTDLQIRNISSLILKAYIILATQESEAYKSAISNICEKYLKIIQSIKLWMQGGISIEIM